MTDKLKKLEETLEETLNKLHNSELKDDELAKELEKSKVISNLATNIVSIYHTTHKEKALKLSLMKLISKGELTQNCNKVAEKLLNE